MNENIQLRFLPHASEEDNKKFAGTLIGLVGEAIVVDDTYYTIKGLSYDQDNNHWVLKARRKK